jgi:hydrogenase maturation protein HypF
LVDDLSAHLPEPARLTGMRVLAREFIAAADRDVDFRILPSAAADTPRIAIPPDLAVCPQCRAEVFDPANRRYGYPFTTCTLCGPRYTVVSAMPYDRERTTLAAFPLCPDCRREYTDPADRRYHAESIACPVCGPRLTLTDGHGIPLPGDPLTRARRALADGRIVAVRGIGGYLLAVDATCRDAVSLLRDRKCLPHKPLAVMAADLATVRRFAEVDPVAEETLASVQAPIVVLPLLCPDRSGEGPVLPVGLLAPDADTLGVMLPTSPLHLLLFQPLADDPTPPFSVLVMTSGNRRSEPTCIATEEALDRLGDIADVVLGHNREINLRNDDSLVAVQARHAPQVWRRGRGFAPAPVMLADPLARTVLAMGAEQKNAMALGFGDQVVLSPHVGDLETPEAVAGLERLVACFPAFHAQTPQVVAVDRHPDMHATRVGIARARQLGVPVVTVQHHHAHAVACMAEHGLSDALALVFDGTGLGPDGTVWGAELLHVTPAGYRRYATFRPAPLPGGDAAVRRPARQVIARWACAGTTVAPSARDRLGVSELEADTWARQARTGGCGAPLSHGAGRVLDAFAAVLGVAPRATTYDGQPPVCLETWARRASSSTALPDVRFATRVADGLLTVDWAPAFAEFATGFFPVDDDARAAWALAVHVAMGRAALAMIEFGVAAVGPLPVVLSGGVFMNRILTATVSGEVDRQGLRAYMHQAVPPNDGGVALGQAVVAGRTFAPPGDPAPAVPTAPA